MKKTVPILGICILAMGIGSCNKEKREFFEILGKGRTASHFFTGILKPQEMIVRTSDGYGANRSDRTSLFIYLSGPTFLQHKPATADEFKRLAEKIGDTEKDGAYRHATPVGYETTESGISGISIHALSQYDEHHPKGSSLNDIVRIRYQSYDYVFNKLIQPTPDYYTMEPGADFVSIKHPALLTGHFTSDGSFKYTLVMTLEFTQAPTNPHQKFLITLSFENGQELKEEVSVDILELKK